jgi:N6-L-threonylcarbamoyladenine synthase
MLFSYTGATLAQESALCKMQGQNIDFWGNIGIVVLYTLQKQKKVTPDIKKDMARQFEDAVCDVLISKVLRAVKLHKVKTVIVGGGVAANTTLRERLTKSAKNESPKASVHFPERKFSTDNAVMIAISAYVRAKGKKLKKNPLAIRAQGNLILS